MERKGEERELREKMIRLSYMREREEENGRERDEYKGGRKTTLKF